MLGSRWFRNTALFLAHWLVIVSLPLEAAAPAGSGAAVGAAGAASAAASAPPAPDAAPAPPVRVNRTVPATTPVPLTPVFSTAPTDEEIFRARVFAEPFVPIGGATAAEENRALADALLAYLRTGNNEDVTAWGAFLEAYPNSAWRASLLTNLGAHYLRTGYFTRGQAVLTEAWRLAKDAGTPLGRATAARALAELLESHMKFGQVEALERFSAEAEGRTLGGAAYEKLSEARRNIDVMRNAHHEAIASAAMAVDRYLAYGRAGYFQHPEVANFRATPEGASLADVAALASRTGLRMQMAYREPGAPVEFPVPAIIHLRQGHFAAMLAERGDHFLLADPMIGNVEMWMSRAALQEEASGYFLVPEGPLPQGWTAVSGQQVRGKCRAASQDLGDTCPDCEQGGGMATYAFNRFLASLQLIDTPVGYAPPRGPAVYFTVSYDQRESSQPQILSFSNLGARWSSAWVGYVEDDPSNLAAPVLVVRPQGGYETHTGLDLGPSAPDITNHSTVVRASVTPIRYERRLPDGSLEVFGLSDGGVSPRRVFLTEFRDPQGNARTYTYDAQLRLVAVIDAVGQVTTLSYGQVADPWKITAVTDPFGRSARFDYDGAGALVRITDVIGIVSAFDYGYGDFVRALTTPYGTTTFAFDDPDNGGTYYHAHWVEATDPLGGKERIEWRWSTAEFPATEPAGAVPTGFINNADLNLRSSFYWDKRAIAYYPDYTKARHTRWLNSPTTNMIVKPIAHSTKMPLENRVWYAQAGESITLGAGPSGLPSKVGRVLDDGASQIYRYEYNPLGKVTRSTDPVGRETVLEYDTNGIDLLRTKQKNPASAGGYDLLQTATYNSLHEPLTITDAAGQTTTYTYNTQGQILTMTTPLRSCTGCAGENRTTTWSYDTNGYLQSVTRPATGATTSYTYDGYGRVRTVTDEDGYVLTYDYDALDRPTKTTYPDSTYEETAYNRLDAEKRRDRLGRWTHAIHDALRRVVSTRDPAGRTTTQQWCSCGSLDKLIDANGNAITWERDLQGRVTRELRADSSDTELVYEATTSRVKQVKDAKDQVRDLLYFSDNTLRQISYSNAPIPSPTVSFTYDPSYRCLATRQDGEGTTTYSYYPIGTPPVLGAGQVSTVDGPLSNDTTTFAYDELGRAVSRAINGVAVSHTYDVLGRLTQESNPLGTFTFAYVGTTGRIGSVTYPNGQTTTLDYLDNVGDHRLKEIHNKLPGGATLSKFNYASDAAGRFNSWTQQVGAGASTVYEYGYDLADQLTAATLKATAPPSVLKSYGYGYDKAGNRTSESIDSVVTAAAFNTVNRLQTQQVGGPLRFAGSVNEAATVTVGGAPAVVGGDNRFQGSATVTTGTNAVPIVSTDPSGNVRTNTYQVTVSGVNKTFTHDPNGNLTADGTRTFEWDAADHLVAVNQGTRRSEFTYDGDDRRVRIVEKDGPAVLSDQRFIWCGDTICEERDGAGTTVVRRFFHLGMQEGGAGYFYSTDHLGSVRELTDGSAALRARYDYDPYGRMTKVSGDKDAAFGFTGHYSHAPSGLSLAIYRAYDPSLARWISEDPIGLEGRDLNFYRYGANGPLNAIDPTGESVIIWVAVGAAAGLFLVTWVATQHIQQHGLPPMPPPIVPPMTMPPFPPPQTKPPTPSPSPILVPPIQTPGGEKKCDDKRGCTCTCLGKVDPNWNPKDPKHGDRYVGHQDNKAECRAECKFRGFDNYQCN